MIYTFECHWKTIKKLYMTSNFHLLSIFNTIQGFSVMENISILNISVRIDYILIQLEILILPSTKEYLKIIWGKSCRIEKSLINQMETIYTCIRYASLWCIVVHSSTWFMECNARHQAWFIDQHRQRSRWDGWSVLLYHINDLCAMGYYNGDTCV